MRFLSGERLWLLLLVGALVAAYFLMQLRRQRDAVRFTNIKLLASVAPARPGWRRHLPAAALVAALGLLVVGFARPTRAVKVPREQATVMLAIDTSRSSAYCTAASARSTARGRRPGWRSPSACDVSKRSATGRDSMRASSAGGLTRFHGRPSATAA